MPWGSGVVLLSWLHTYLRMDIQVGFYCGQSAVVFLEANPKVKIIGFDDFSYAAGEACYNHLQHKYPGRINVYRGLSQDTIPALIAEHSKTGVYMGPVCDVIRTDARPEYTLRRQDFAALQPMTSCSTLVLFNDVCNVQNCHLYQVRAMTPPPPPLPGPGVVANLLLPGRPGPHCGSSVAEF